MTNPAIAMVNSRFYSSGFEVKHDTAQRYFMIASGLPDKIATAVQARTP